MGGNSHRITENVAGSCLGISEVMGGSRDGIEDAEGRSHGIKDLEEKNHEIIEDVGKSSHGITEVLLEIWLVELRKPREDG